MINESAVLRRVVFRLNSNNLTNRVKSTDSVCFGHYCIQTIHGIKVGDPIQKLIFSAMLRLCKYVKAQAIQD